MSDTSESIPVCQATRYVIGKCDGPARFQVVYRTRHGGVADSHPACFRHGLAEVERHNQSGGIARCDLEET